MTAVERLASVFVLLGFLAGTAAAVNIETVTVADPGNAADTRYASPAGFGSVGYTYNIGKYEVTAGQYAEFLNAVAATDTYGLYNADMWNDTLYGCKIQQTGTAGSYTYSVASGYANRPVNYVSYWDACRFTNWLSNGQSTGAQGAGTTERGTYTLDGYDGSDGGWIQRNPGSTWAVASEGEWYKAAYYKGGSTNAGYWDYPTSSDAAPGQDMADASGNNANWNTPPWTYPIDSPHYTTMVGEFQDSASPYGTFDQGGNVWEWTEAMVATEVQYPTDAYRFIRGGSFYPSYNQLSASDFGDCEDPSAADRFNVGFRVVQLPEPTSLALLALCGVGMLIRRRGHAR